MGQERAIVARLMLPGEDVPTDPFEEICGLSETAGCIVVGKLLQRRQRPDVSTYIGKGKVEELKRLLEAEMADVVVFDNDLSPGQGRNLEKAVGKRVVDRSQLILDIFATNARTYESRLAVELAQLEYSLPRLRRMWTHLSRISMGVGMRGPGEKQLEVDRRLAQRRIFELKQELSEIEQRRSRQVASRSDRASVSLVGYTNVGKSTLLNALTGANALAEDRLFATLETRTRRWQLPGWGPVLLSDTVGFIRDLPHHLIASFKATLEETTHADLLLHVADAANPNVFRQIAAVFEVLRELHIDEKDALLVLNKVDRIEEEDLRENAEEGVCPVGERLKHLLELYPNAIPISAASGYGLQRLAAAVGDALSREFLELEVTVDPSNGRLMAHLAATGEVLQRKVVGEQVVIHCRLPPRALGLVEQQAISIVRKKVPQIEEIRAEEEVA